MAATWVDFKQIKVSVAIEQVFQRYGARVHRIGGELGTFPPRRPVPADDIPPAANAPLPFTLHQIDRHHPYLGLTEETIRTFGVDPSPSSPSGRAHSPTNWHQNRCIAS